MKYLFEWDPQKEKENIQKHKIKFERAAAVFRDPQMISIFDDEHSETEDRWVTVGLDKNGILLIVSHTFEKIDNFLCNIRIISARKAVKNEIRQYKELHL